MLKLTAMYPGSFLLYFYKVQSYILNTCITFRVTFKIFFLKPQFATQEMRPLKKQKNKPMYAI